MAIAIAVTSPAVLAIRNQPCSNCSPSQMESSARSAGLGTIYIWNPYGGEIRKFVSYCGTPQIVAESEGAPLSVERSVEPNGVCGTMAFTTEEYPVEQQYADAAPHVGYVWIASNGSWIVSDDGLTKASRGIRVPLSGRTFNSYPLRPPTVGDFMTDFQLRQEISDYVSEHGLDGASSPMRSAFNYLFAHADAAFGFTQGIQLTFEVVFQDGSSLQMIQSLNQQADFKSGSGRDSVGLAVPEANAANFAGNWTYDPNSGRYARGRLIDLLDRLNANINYMDSNGYRISCTWDGQTLHCTVRR